MQVQAAMIMMAIMGCDDSATHCVQLSASQPKWQTVAACDKASEKVLENYTNADYPMVIAICQSPQVINANSDALSDAQQQASQQADASKPEPTLAQKTIDLVKKAIPTTEGIKSAFSKPVHVITDSYSWVARKFHNDQ